MAERSEKWSTRSPEAPNRNGSELGHHRRPIYGRKCLKANRNEDKTNDRCRQFDYGLIFPQRDAIQTWTAIVQLLTPDAKSAPRK